MVEAQGGDGSAFDDRGRLPRARLHRSLTAHAAGYVSELDALTVAHASTLLGAGRERKGEPIDLSVGLVLARKIGDRVSRGEPLAELFANDESRLEQAERALRGAYRIRSEPVSPRRLILERVQGASAARPGV
jgi:pyrimidine-nucleoside phosphorylase